MGSSSSDFRRASAGRLPGVVIAVSLAVASLLVGGPALAEGKTWVAEFWDAFSGGTASLNMRGRIEIADTDTREHSEAYTVRTRLGYGTKPFYGFSVYADFENIAAIKKERYWNVVDPDNGHRAITQHQLERGHVVGGGAVNRSVGAGRIARDHPAEGGARRGGDIGAKPQSMRRELGVELIEHHPRPHPHRPTLRIEIGYALIVAREVDHQPTAECAAREPGAGAARCDLDAGVRGLGEQPRRLRCGARERDRRRLDPVN